MPYIRTEDRLKFEDTIKNLPPIDAPGELNYLITMICLEYAKQHGVSYSTYNSIIGVLECAKMEFYRQEIAPYEILKIKENGPLK